MGGKMLAIVEISGADSIAAALRFAESAPGVALVPTYVSTGTEFGSFSAIEGNVDFLRTELERRAIGPLGELVRASDPALWRALNGKPAGRLVELFGAWLPCVGCHLYLHLMRIPIARQTGADIVVSGERVRHGQRTKANQRADTLRAYAHVLAHAGLDLQFPVEAVTEASGIAEALGPDWPGGSPQLDCVLKGNERPLANSECVVTPDGLLDLYIRPAGIAIADEMLAGGTRWDEAVDRVLEAAAEARR
jgi:hypothetical protein